jgi:hypothetical protein
VYLVGGGCGDHGGRGLHGVAEQQPLVAVLACGSAVAASSAPDDLERGSGDLFYPGRPRTLWWQPLPDPKSERPRLNFLTCPPPPNLTARVLGICRLKISFFMFMFF